MSRHEDIIGTISSRTDIYKHIVPENPLLRVCEVAHQIEQLRDEFNALSKNLRSFGFNQFPEIFMIDAFDQEDGSFDFSFEHILELCEQDPRVIGKRVVETLHEMYEHQESLENPYVPKEKRDPTLSIKKRLGVVPEQWLCHYCRGAGSESHGPDGRVWHVDHEYPISIGGDNRKDNKVLACATCNLRKHDKTASEFIIKRIS